MLAGALFWPALMGCAQEHSAPHVEAELEHAGELLDDAAAHGKPDPLSVDPDLAIWTFGVFLVLLAVLWKFAWGPISKSLDEREQAVARFIAEAKHSHDEAKRLLGEHERILAGAADEVRALLEEARRDAEATKLDILAEAKAGAEAERLRALREIEGATDGALKQLAERSADLAVELAGKIVSVKLSSADHAQLIQEAVARFPTNPSRN